MRSSRQLALIVSLALPALACEPLNRPPEVTEVLHQFGVSPESHEREQTPPKVRLYFDRSLSMRGFVAVDGSLYLRVVEALLDHAATTAAEVEQFGFDTQPRLLGDAETSLAMTPGFYNGRDSNFQRLFAEAAPSPGKVSVVVSDLVQSVKGTDARALASALRDLGKANPEILLLAFRSAFQGKYYVEAPASQEKTLPIDFDGMSSHSGRPFYVLVLAASQEDLDFCRRNLYADFPAAERYLASEAAFEVVDLAPVPEGEVHDNRWNLFRKSTAVEVLPRGRTISLLALGPSQLSPPLLRLTMTVEKRAPLRSLVDLDWELSARALRQRKWETKETAGLEPRLRWAPKPPAPQEGGERRERPREETSSSEAKPETSEIWLELPVERPPSGGWDAYRLRMKPGAGNLLPPFWVEAWSTDDDGDPSQAHRTLQLDLFVEALIRSIQERVVLTDQLILLGKE